MVATTKFIPTSSEPPSNTDVKLALPPWTLKATSWIFTARIPPSSQDVDSESTSQNQNNVPDILQGFPPGAYSPFETVHESALSKINDKPQRRGSTASVCIVRYSDSPVGPYDELIFLVHGFANPKSRDVTTRISNIYVSTEASVWNGRRNWNIPKHVARFEWESAGPRCTILKVYHHASAPAPLSSSKPFFTIKLSTSRIPRMPISPALLGKRSWMIQPPLNEGTSPSAIGTHENTPWLSIMPRYKGSWGRGYADPVPADKEGLSMYGDGVGFPKVVLASRRGMSFAGDLIFPVGYIVEEEPKNVSKM